MGGYLTALALVCVFAANVGAFAPPSLGSLASAPLRASLCASARKTAVSPLRMQHSEVSPQSWRVDAGVVICKTISHERY